MEGIISYHMFNRPSCHITKLAKKSLRPPRGDRVVMSIRKKRMSIYQKWPCCQAADSVVSRFSTEYGYRHLFRQPADDTVLHG